MTRRRLLTLAASGVASGLAMSPKAWAASTTDPDAGEIVDTARALVEMYAAEPLNGLDATTSATAQERAIAAYRAATATERAELLKSCAQLNGARALRLSAMTPSARADVMRQLGWLRFAADPEDAVPAATHAARARRAIEAATRSLTRGPSDGAPLEPHRLNFFFDSAPVACAAPKELVRKLGPSDQALQDAATTAITWIAAAITSVQGTGAEATLPTGARG